MSAKNTYYSEHENWIRYNCLAESCAINRFKSLEKILEDARTMENYCLGRQPGEVIPLRDVKAESAE